MPNTPLRSLRVPESKARVRLRGHADSIGSLRLMALCPFRDIGILRDVYSEQ